jgi:hypothetical protein
MKNPARRSHPIAIVRGSYLALIVFLMLPAYAAAQEDPCGLTKSPTPPRLAAVGFDVVMMQKNDSAYRTAWVEWTAAVTGVLRANNDIASKYPEDFRRRTLAEIEQRANEIKGPKDLLENRAEFARVCGEVLQLRIDLTTTESGRARLVDLMNVESRALRARAALSVERSRALYNTETDRRLAADGKDAQASMKLVSADLARAVAQRDRLKALVVSR